MAISFHRAETSTGKPCGRVLDFFEQVHEGVLGQQADVFGEHGEEAALEESGDDLGVVAVVFEGLGELGEAALATSRVTSAACLEGSSEWGSVQILRRRSRISGRWRSVRMDAVGGGVREALVMAAGAGELGVEIDGVADIADDEKRRAALGGGQGGDVARGPGGRRVGGPCRRRRCRACRGRSCGRAC